MNYSCDFHYADRVFDIITGYEGIVTAKCDYYGKRPEQYLVESIDKTERPCEYWVDSNRLQLVKGVKIK